MKIDVSSLMDGEMDKSEADAVIGRLARDEELRDTWKTYHLIGDALRKNVIDVASVQAKTFVRLSSEPTVFAPRRTTAPGVVARIALAAAASIATVSVVAWLAHQEPAPAVASADALRPAAFSVPNDYWLAHQQVSMPASAIGPAEGRSVDDRAGLAPR